MVLPLEKAVNSLFTRMGRIGNYKERQVLFLLSAPDEVVGIGFVKAQTPTAKLQLRVSDAPEYRSEMRLRLMIEYSVFPLSR